MLAYVWEHIIAIVALITTLTHIAQRTLQNRRLRLITLGNAEKIGTMLMQAASQGAAWEAGKPVTISVPSESITVDLSKEGLGKVTIAESGAVLVISKAP